MDAPSNESRASRPAEKPCDTTPLCDGRFVPFRKLGAGSQASTFEAVDRVRGCAVALKRFDVHDATSWKDVELAEREATILSTLRHPSLPAYVLHFEENGALYLAMEKVDGQDLAKRLEKGQRFALVELIDLLDMLADVLAYLHGQSPPVVHRDIKPSNIIQRHEGGFALIDFGSVRNGLRPQGGSTVVGTFGYMAPEQFQGRAVPATDLYGVGATLLTILTGQTPDKLPHRGLEIDIDKALPPTVPGALRGGLKRLLCADPDQRAVDLKALVSELRVALLSKSPPENPEAQGGTTSRSSEPLPRAEAAVPVAIDSRSGNERDWVSELNFFVPRPVLILLAIARVIVFLALQVAVPLVLTLLSLVFGRSLQKAARDVTEAGNEVHRQLGRVLAQLSATGHRHGAPRQWSGECGPGEGFKEAQERFASPPKRKADRRRVRVGNFEVNLDDQQLHDEDAKAKKRDRR